MGDYNDPFMRNRDATVQARAKAQNRATVLQLKLIGQSHPTGLTTNLLKLFEPRHPLEYKPPPEKRKCLPYTGMAQFVSSFAEPGQPEYAPPVQEGETPAQRRARIHSLRLEKGAIKAGEELQKYDPSKDLNISGDPYKTLFVARLSYETTEHRIKREFEAYGPIKRVGILEHPQGGAQVRMITDKDTNKPRGYAFVEYLHTRDMKTAYKQADGRKLDNRRVLVDVERGRTVPNWRPRRLGGGLGSTRVGGEEVNQRYSGREPQQIISGAPRSEEPRAREDRHVDREREKSRERGRDREREREKSRERSHDKIRDRDPREERHHRDRDRRERERNRGWDRDHDRTRDHDRERGRDRDRDRERGRDRDRDRDYDHDRGRDRDHQRSREREREYDRGDRERTRDREGDHDYVEPRREREHAGERDREYEFGEPERDREWFDEHVEPEHGYERDEHVDPERGYEHHDPGQVYDHLKPEKSYDHVKPERERERDRYEHLEPEHDRELYDRRDPDRDHEQHERAEPDSDNRRYDRAESEPRERARDREKEEYNRSKRSISREYER